MGEDFSNFWVETAFLHEIQNLGILNQNTDSSWKYVIFFTKD